LKLAFLNFLRIFSSIVLDLCLIYNQKYYYASSLNKLDQLFYAYAAGSCSCYM